MLIHLQKLLLLPVRRRPASLVHRALLSTAAVGASPTHFAAEDYLVTTCGLTKERATKAAKHISHCKSPSNADAVLSFLASPALGLSKADIAHLVSRDARILNCSVDETLRPRFDAFLTHGFTATQIRTFLRGAPLAVRCLHVDEYSDLNRALTVNIQLLRESGLSDADVAKLCLDNPRLLTKTRDNVRAIIAGAVGLGIPRDSPTFRRAVLIVSRIGPEAIPDKLKFIRELLGCSDAEVAKAVKMVPGLLTCSRKRFHRVLEFLTKVVGLDSKYILGRTCILLYSLERRIAPRHYVMKVLKEKGLLRKQLGFYTWVTVTNKYFLSRCIIRYKDVLPGLADAYASACKGKLPT